MPSTAERGFTLLEVMIALAILALGLTAAFKLQAEDLTVARRAAQTTRACLKAESALAQWRIGGLPDKGRPEAAGADGLRLTWRLEPVEGRAGLERIRLEIEANDGSRWDFERLKAKEEAK